MRMNKGPMTNGRAGSSDATATTEEQVILVDERDCEIGVMGKMEAHRVGALHRAFSVMIGDGHDHLLLQRRASGKYHSPGLWSNACCGHPRPGESMPLAAMRRVEEELGIAVTLEPAGCFTYRASVGDLEEHEVDHVFAARHSGVLSFDPAEVAECRWVGVDALWDDLERKPSDYTPWLPKVLALWC